MKKFTGIIITVLSLFAISAQAAEPAVPSTVTAEKPIKVGDICLWQPTLLSKQAASGWLAEKCVPGVSSTEGKGKVTLIVSDGVLFLYPHQGKPTQNPPYTSQARVQDDLLGGRKMVKTWAAKNGVPIHDPYKQL